MVEQLSDTKAQLDDVTHQLEESEEQLSDTKAQLDDVTHQLDESQSKAVWLEAKIERRTKMARNKVASLYAEIERLTEEAEAEAASNQSASESEDESNDEDEEKKQHADTPDVAVQVVTTQARASTEPPHVEEPAQAVKALPQAQGLAVQEGAEEQAKLGKYSACYDAQVNVLPAVCASVGSADQAAAT